MGERLPGDPDLGRLRVALMEIDERAAVRRDLCAGVYAPRLNDGTTERWNVDAVHVIAPTLFNEGVYTRGVWTPYVRAYGERPSSGGVDCRAPRPPVAEHQPQAIRLESRAFHGQ